VKKIIVLIVFGFVISAGLRFCNREQPPTEVQLEALKRRNLRTVVTGTGEVKPKVSVDISSDVMGRVVQVPVEEGQKIEKGQMLVEIDRNSIEARLSGLQSALESAQASLEQARTNLTRTKKTYERQTNMYKQKLVSDSVYEDAQTAAENAVAAESMARASLAQAQAQFRETQNQVEKYRIVAPMTGVLTRKEIEEGEMAVAGTLSVPGTLLMTISDLSVMEVEVDVDEVDVVQLKIGQPAEVTVDAYPDRIWKGDVTEVGTSALEKLTADQAKDFRVVITLREPAQELKPGLSASADIVTATRDNVLSIPTGALTVRSTNELRGGKDGLPLDDPTPTAEAESGEKAAGSAGRGGAGGAEAATAPEKIGSENQAGGSGATGTPAPIGTPTAADDDEPKELEGAFVLQAEAEKVKEGAPGHGSPIDVAKLAAGVVAILVTAFLVYMVRKRGGWVRKLMALLLLVASVFAFNQVTPLLGPRDQEKKPLQGKALFRQVKLGIPGESHFEVLEGLQEGDKVVTGPYEALRKLKDGEVVREKSNNWPGKR
jgi:HlyD family secretion protein